MSPVNDWSTHAAHASTSKATLDAADPIQPPFHVKIEPHDYTLLDFDATQMEPEDPNSSVREHNEEWAEYATKRVVGPMPAHDFLNFLPEVAGPMPSASEAFDSLPTSFYDDVGAALHKILKDNPWCPGYEFKQFPWSKRDSLGQLCCLRQNTTCLWSPANPRTGNFASEFSIDVRDNEWEDIFADPGYATAVSTHEFIRTCSYSGQQKAAEQALGRMQRCAQETLIRQHRIFCFSVSIHGTNARLIRWDHAGAVVSASFSLLEYPELLCEFLWRWAHAPSVDRGFDPTVEPATAKEEELFRSTVAQYISAQLGVTGGDLQAHLNVHHHKGAVSAVTMVGQNQAVLRCLISRPMAVTHLPGRYMRGYWGVCDGFVVFLKDSWPDSDNGLVPEGTHLQHLHRRGVPHIPKLLCHGFVLRAPVRGYRTRSKASEESREGIQATLTHTWLKMPWSCTSGRRVRVRCLRHYRLLLGTVGFPLRTATGTKELLHATYDAFQAMRGALNMGLLHRDISPGNIVLVKEGENDVRTGYLIDFEYSAYMDSQGAVMDGGSIGTPGFQSQRILQKSQNAPAHTFQDDMESLIYVVIYLALRLLHHRYSRPNAVIKKFFHNKQAVHPTDPDMQTELRTGSLAAQAKAENKLSRKHIDPAMFEGSFARWLRTALEYNHPRQELPDGTKVEPVEELSRNWESPEPLSEFWSRFLLGEELPNDDRVHPVPFPVDDAISAPKSATWSAVVQSAAHSLSTRRSCGSNKKRKAQPVANGTAPKRSRRQ